MNNDLATKILIAHACCHNIYLACSDCPRWSNEKSECLGWTEDEVHDAVRMLKGEMKANKEDE